MAIPQNVQKALRYRHQTEPLRKRTKGLVRFPSPVHTASELNEYLDFQPFDSSLFASMDRPKRGFKPENEPQVSDDLAKCKYVPIVIVVRTKTG